MTPMNDQNGKDRAGLKVSEPLVRLIEDEALPGRAWCQASILARSSSRRARSSRFTRVAWA